MGQNGRLAQQGSRTAGLLLCLNFPLVLQAHGTDGKVGTHQMFIICADGCFCFESSILLLPSSFV